MDPVLTALHLSILLISVALLYDQAARRIPTELRTKEAPKPEFGVVPVAGFVSELSTSGIE